MAQKTRTQLTTASNNTFKDTPPANITPPNHRAFNNDCIDSFANLEETNTFSGINTFNASVKVNNKLDTAYAFLGGGATMNLGAAPGNFLEIGNSGYTINSFGTATQGTWRFIKFSGNGTLNNSTAIQCPTNADINFVAGDTCMVVSLGSGNWIVFNYQKKDGSSVAASVYPWSYNINPPGPGEDQTTGYFDGYRWIEANGPTKREWALNDQSNASTWMLMAGRIGIPGNQQDLNLAALSYSGIGDSGGITILDFDIRYQLVSDVMTMDGYIQATNIDLDNASPNFIFIFDCTNDKGLNFFGPSTVTTAIGHGSAEWNQLIPPHAYNVFASGDPGNNELSIGIETKNPHFGSGGEVRIYFTLTCGVAML
jgi:hypothetical protein